MPLHMLLITYSPAIGLVIAIVLFIRHRKSEGPKKPLFPLLYFPVVVGSGLLGYLAGTSVGLWTACTLPQEPGNLCGLFGYLITGPLTAALAQVLAAVLLIRLAKRTGQETGLA